MQLTEKELITGLVVEILVLVLIISACCLCFCLKFRRTQPTVHKFRRTQPTIESTDAKGKNWFTIGVSTNIIDASFKALVDSLDYKLFKDNAPASL